MAFMSLLGLKRLWARASTVLKNRASTLAPPVASEGESKEDSETRAVQASAYLQSIQRLRQAAWNGYISDGELQQGYLALRSEYAAQQALKAARLDMLSERQRALEARLEAIIYRPAPPEQPRPEPKILRPNILSFNKGAARHG